MRKNYFPYLIIVFFFSTLRIIGQPAPGAVPHAETIPWQSGFNTPWVDSVFASLSLDQRIAQLIMVSVFSDQSRDYYNRLERQLREFGPGGIIFFRGGPVRQVNITNRLQAASRTPLLVAMDAEHGPAMRLDSVTGFPNHLTLGAIPGEILVYQMAFEAGKQLRRLGVHMSFAPVLDVNNNPGNPVINFRSFGESRHNVSQKGIAYMRGLHDAGIIAVAKHFPGHGDTHLDSHHVLPQLEQSRQQLDSIHIYPYAQLISNGLHAIMTAHLEIPAIEPEKNRAASLSKNVIEGVLRNDLGFKGLVMTDALNMKGVADFFARGDRELQALLAGNDMLLMAEDIGLAIRTIKKAVENGTVDVSDFNLRVRKVLYYKEMLGLNNLSQIPVDNLLADLNTRNAEVLNIRLAQAGVTLVRNENQIVPLRDLPSRKIAVLSIGALKGNHFQTMLSNFYNVVYYSLPKGHTQTQSKEMAGLLAKYNLVIIGVHRNNNNPARNYGISRANIDFITKLGKRQDVILTLFANPYSLIAFGPDALKLNGIVVAYQEGRNFEEAAAQIIFGGIPATGRLPVSAPPWFPAYKGYNTPQNFRIQFAVPEMAGIKPEYLLAIDSIAQLGIDSMAYPGCQIAIIKDGMLIYHKAFGHHTYEKTQPVRLTDLYDLASITKIAATTATLMHLVDQGKLDLHKNIGHYLPYLANTNKAPLGLRDVLAHQARLRAWIPFQQNTIENRMIKPGLFNNHFSNAFSLRVANELYLATNYRDSIIKQISDSPLLNRRRYLYSDLGFILLTDIVKFQSGLPLDQYAAKTFYEPMGLGSIRFNPLEKFLPEMIVPTETDTVFRRQTIRGFVNDPAAALLGGVAGHAGLFSNALDLAVLMQMFLQSGEYGGIQYLQPETVREFTRVQFAGNQNRRGLGFDKPTLTPSQVNPASNSASPLSFGHSGFTGTFAWVDPTENLVYVFLSNRTFPFPSNRALMNLEIRQRIHQAIYDAIFKSADQANSQIHN